MSEPRIAPDGQVWVCGACGKTSKDRYGSAQSSWDESCMLNSVLCYDRQPWEAVNPAPFELAKP